ncbi:prepilin-type N-terminal cleavage/methylation domain-containing protein [Marinospirillum sp.]|uniref:PulJ/GspJ family protein n=1 Tax=Marinospirillum sp. TaxID=2183934 RepID=UPI00286FE314|nr:prepilin-type N-terminal cleavage/methylation domain-containing protein [Marinospirillum sp.]MDR9468853.1 prepilin-type N-terminal cleavage/methylation domain-containing protein [Marinospirillum sp.]
MMESRQANQGFSLVEMLVALALGALMMAGIASSFTAITQAQQLTRDYEQVQETLRFTTAMISRSLRTAEHLANTTDNTQLVIQREGDGERVACNGQKPSSDFDEIYSLIGSDLQCEVVANSGSSSWEGTVILAYGIENIGLECMTFDNIDERNFRLASASPPGQLVGCGDSGLNHSEVIAVQITIKFDTTEFMQLEGYPSHTFTATLRSHLRTCASGGSC